MLHEEIRKLSKRTLRLKGNQLVYNYNIIIGYFSCSYANNSDIEMMKNVLIKILRRHSNVKLLLLGEIE